MSLEEMARILWKESFLIYTQSGAQPNQAIESANQAVNAFIERFRTGQPTKK